MFARKILQPFGRVKREDIRNELRAVDKLCKSLYHPNIVPVLNYGTMERYYFLDMELCDLTLEMYLRQEWDEAMACKLPYFSTPLPSRMKMIQILGIMEDIAAGVTFIHENNEIHRDLKPRNSMPPFIARQTYCY
jgi:serine/threonine protein kinase